MVHEAFYWWSPDGCNTLITFKLSGLIVYKECCCLVTVKSLWTYCWIDYRLTILLGLSQIFKNQHIWSRTMFTVQVECDTLIWKVTCHPSPWYLVEGTYQVAPNGNLQSMIWYFSVHRSTKYIHATSVISSLTSTLSPDPWRSSDMYSPRDVVWISCDQNFTKFRGVPVHVGSCSSGSGRRCLLVATQIQTQTHTHTHTHTHGAQWL